MAVSCVILKFYNNTIAIIALLQDWSQSRQKSLTHKKNKNVKIFNFISIPLGKLIK